MAEKKKTGEKKLDDNNISSKLKNIEDIEDTTMAKEYLTEIKLKLSEGEIPPIFAEQALNYILQSPRIEKLLNKENKEIAKDIWFALKQKGVQIATPFILSQD